MGITMTHRIGREQHERGPMWNKIRGDNSMGKTLVPQAVGKCAWYGKYPRGGQQAGRVNSLSAP